MRTASGLAAALLLLATYTAPALAKDDLLETLAQKGVISVEEYEKLKNQRKTEVLVNTDDGFRLSSSDGAFTFQPGTLQQIDFAWYDSDKADLADGSEVRRSRLSAGGTFFKTFQYRVEYEFNGASNGVTDAYVAYTGHTPLTVTVGQFKQPFSMEAMAADKNGTFMERGLPFAFVITRAPGLMIGYGGARSSANLGVFGEPLTSAQAGDEGWAIVGRASYAPLLTSTSVVHLGIGATLRYPTDDNSTNTTGPKFATARFRAKPESNILSQRLVDTGEIQNVDNYQIGGLEFAAATGALSLQTEYQVVKVEREGASTLDFSGWYAQAAYTLSGEARPYRADRGVFEGIRPRNNFGADGWGAFEFAARISGIDLSNDTINGGKQRNASAALNWYPNNLIRASLNYVKVLDVKGGSFDGDEPGVVQLRVQLAI